MDKITIYTLINGKLEKEQENFDRVVEMISHAMMTNLETSETFVQECEKEGKRLIAVYPEFGNVDTSGWDFLGEIPDGSLYVGQVE
ncbi:hypothetical protein [uncultured Rikenella sp.]|uniref:hypothetical protein n=1 Tax=uncultured Rikenella sp. TaxID=368003 RepID=UPI00262EF972|nr:hypothetical protein [uncultured Rikenella sp.]